MSEMDRKAQVAAAEARSREYAAAAQRLATETFAGRRIESVEVDSEYCRVGGLRLTLDDGRTVSISYFAEWAGDAGLLFDGLDVDP